MGNLEKISRKRARRQNVSKLILQTVGAAGILGVAVVAPNVIGAMGKLGLLPNGRQKETIDRSRDRLLQQGLLKRTDTGLSLTAAGEHLLQKAEMQDVMHAKRRWDKKWRVLIFDIPEKRRSVREKLRRTLFAMGFERLQDSVWVCPYDCEEVIALLKTDYKIGHNMLYLIVEEMEGSLALKQKFNLT